MVDGYIATLANIFESYGAANSSCATGDGGGFGEEKVVGHVFGL